MFSSGSSPVEMDQLDQVFDLLNKREAMRLVEFVSEKCEIPHLAVDLGVFLAPPRHTRTPEWLPSRNTPTLTTIRPHGNRKKFLRVLLRGKRVLNT